MAAIVGNGKRVELCVNAAVLRIVGNGCYVSVAKNEGQIVVTGNKGHVRVVENLGHIYYTGNKGLIEVGSTARGIGQVVYTGNGGTVRKMKPEEQEAPSPPPKKKSEGHGVQGELRVNGVEASLNHKSTPAANTCCREVWRVSGKKKSVRKNIQLSHKRNIQVAGLPNLDLENWCLNLATELVAL